MTVEHADETPAPRRILVISPWGLAGGYSGPLTLMDRLFSALDDQGIQVDVLYRDRGTEGTAPGWAERVFPIRLKAPYSRVQQVRWGLRVRRFLRRHGSEYTAIHLHGFYLGNQVAVIRNRIDARVVALPVLDDGDLGSPTGSSLSPKRALTRMALTSVDVGFALSDAISRQFVALGMPAARVRDIGNPADESAFDAGAVRAGVHEPVALGFVGKVGGFKNPDLVVKALHEGRNRGHDWTATFVGPFPDDETRLRVERLVGDLGLESCTTFTGFTTDVSSRLAEIDVFVLPSSQEGLPGALCEAMAAGLPCVVTDVGSMGVHVRAANAGIVVDPTADAVASAVAEVTGTDWQRYSAHARDYALEHFRPSRVARDYAEVVRSRSTAGVAS